MSTTTSADWHSAISFDLCSGLNQQFRIVNESKSTNPPTKKKYTRKSSVRGSGGPGGGVDDGDGDAVGEVVDGEAGGGQYAGDVAGEPLGGGGHDEAGLAGARVADDDDSQALLARQIRERHACAPLPLPRRVLATGVWVFGRDELIS